MLPTTAGQRLAVQYSSVRSAYCPPAAWVAADSAAMPDSLTDVDLGDEQAVASSRCEDKQTGAGHARVRDRPEYQHLRTGATKLLHQPGQAVVPHRVIGG